MNSTENTVLNAAEALDPNAPVVQAAEAVVATAADPSPEVILADLTTAHNIIAEFKAKMAGLHPSISNLLKALF